MTNVVIRITNPHSPLVIENMPKPSTEQMHAAIPMDTLEVVLGLGSNLPQAARSSRAILTETIADLRLLSHSERPFRVSRLYLSAPVGPEQPDYLNAAVLLSFNGTAIELLTQLQELEHRAGRVRQERWGPRTLDLDILYIRGVSLNSEELTVPHRELVNRPFAYIPLLEVYGEPQDPRTGRVLASRYGPVEADQMCEIDSELWWKTLP